MTVRAVTDERGSQCFGEELHPRMGVEDVYSSRKDPWSMEVGRPERCRLGDLLSSTFGGVHLLANFLFREGIALATDECSVCRGAAVVEITVGGKVFRANSHKIFMHKALSR